MSFFPKNLKYLRKKFDISQEQLGFQVEKRQTTIGNWENKVSEPNINELVQISNFFGISLDYLILIDLEQGKVITEQDVLNFKEKGKVIGKPIGKVMGQNPPISEVQNKTSILNDPQEENMLWAVLQTLRQMDIKLDGVRDSVDSIASKKA
jgi:transcriptional regulator with XRE-family HTH domain